jgi:hypothetical protein
MNRKILVLVFAMTSVFPTEDCKQVMFNCSVYVHHQFHMNCPVIEPESQT